VAVVAVFAAAAATLSNWDRAVATAGRKAHWEALVVAGVAAVQPHHDSPSLLEEVAGGGHGSAVAALLTVGAPVVETLSRARYAFELAADTGRMAVVDALATMVVKAANARRELGVFLITADVADNDGCRRCSRLGPADAADGGRFLMSAAGCGNQGGLLFRSRSIRKVTGRLVLTFRFNYAYSTVSAACINKGCSVSTTKTATVDVSRVSHKTPR